MRRVALTYVEYQVLLVTVAWIGGFSPLLAHAAARRVASQRRGVARYALEPRSSARVVWDARVDAFARWGAGPTPQWRWWQAVGLALVLSPFVRMGVGVYFDVIALVRTTVTGGFVVLPAYSTDALWTKAWRHAFYYFLVPAFGLLLVWRGRATRQNFARAGLAPRESASRDALHGLALFFVILIAYVGAMTLAYMALRDIVLTTGDESQIWANITIPLIIVLSGVAGVTEEFLFRGLMLSSFARVMPWGVAAVVQAVAFGLVHAGYMTWAHVLGPLAFGLGMAWVTRVLGIVPAVLLHAEVNIVFFSIDVADVNPMAWGLVAALAALNVYAAYVTRLAAVRKLWHSIVRGVPESGPPGQPETP